MPVPARPPLRVRIVLPGDRSGGGCAVVEVRVDPPGAAVGPHVVDGYALDVRVLDGRAEVLVDDRVHALAPGDRLHVPPRVPRALRANGSCRLLCAMLPAGLEQLALLAADPALAPDDRAALLAAAGVRVLPRGLWR